jgi:uncharacterized protein
MTRISGSCNTLLNPNDEDAMEFLDSIKDIVCIPEFLQLKNYRHHLHSNRFQHCLNVAWYSFKISKRRHLNCRSCARGALLHDFYLYSSSRREQPLPGRHCAVHPQVALSNALKYFQVDEVMYDCIVNHMFPTTGMPPLTSEGWIVSRVDKYCAVLEWSEYYSRIFAKFLQLLFGNLLWVKE